MGNPCVTYTDQYRHLIPVVLSSLTRRPFSTIRRTRHLIRDYGSLCEVYVSVPRCCRAAARCMVHFPDHITDDRSPSPRTDHSDATSEVVLTSLRRARHMIREGITVHSPRSVSLFIYVVARRPGAWFTSRITSRMVGPRRQGPTIRTRRRKRSSHLSGARDT